MVLWFDFAMIGHTQLFLWSRYSDSISFLTFTVRGGGGVSNKHCLLPVFIDAGSTWQIGEYNGENCNTYWKLAVN